MKSNTVTELSVKDAQSIITAVEEHLSNFTVGHPTPGKELVRNALKHARKDGTVNLVKPFTTLYTALREVFANKPGGVPSKSNPHIILISGPETFAEKTVSLELEIPAPVFAKAKRAASRYGRNVSEVLPIILGELTESLASDEEPWINTGIYPSKEAAQRAVDAHLAPRKHVSFQPIVLEYRRNGKVHTGRFWAPGQREAIAKFQVLMKRCKRAIATGHRSAAIAARREAEKMVGCRISGLEKAA